MKCLIAGGYGFIGRAMAADLLEDSAQSVGVFDNLSTSRRENLRMVGGFSEFSAASDFTEWPAPLALVEGDILDARPVTGADILIRLAANTDIPQSVADPEHDCRTNVIGVLNLLEGCRAAGIRRFVFASSNAPLEVQKTPPVHEQMPPRPASPYCASKLAGEGSCSAYHHCFGIETVDLRFGNIYGEGSDHKGSVVAKVIRAALRGEPLEVYGDGSQSRTQPMFRTSRAQSAPPRRRRTSAARPSKLRRPPRPRWRS